MILRSKKRRGRKRRSQRRKTRVRSKRRRSKRKTRVRSKRRRSKERSSRRIGGLTPERKAELDKTIYQMMAETEKEKREKKVDDVKVQSSTPKAKSLVMLAFEQLPRPILLW